MLIDKKFPDEEFRIMTIAHSHGGNVVIEAANQMHQSIELVVNLATPKRDDYKTKNIKNLFNIYAQNDLIQWGGSFEMTNRYGNKSLSERFKNWHLTPYSIMKSLYESSHDEDNRKVETTDDCKLFNVSITYDGNMPGAYSSMPGKQSHSDIPKCIAALPKLIPQLVASAPDGDSFKIDIELMDDLINYNPKSKNNINNFADLKIN